jgi:hypothetical protein
MISEAGVILLKESDENLDAINWDSVQICSRPSVTRLRGQTEGGIGPPSTILDLDPQQRTWSRMTQRRKH